MELSGFSPKKRLTTPHPAARRSMSRKCDEYYQPDNCINTGTRPELMCEECLIAELPRIRTENAALKNALAQWEGEDGHGARWVKRVEVAEATIKARDERIAELEKKLDRSITFRLTTPNPPQQER